MAKCIEIDKSALQDLIARVEHAIEHELALSSEDLVLLLSAVQTLCAVHAQMTDNDITLHKLRKLLGMVRQSESRRAPGSRQRLPRHPAQSATHRPAKTAPTVVHHKLTDIRKGDLCPQCHRGKLAKYTPGILLRITGHAAFEATKHITEQLRCNTCQAVVKASLPEAVLADGHVNQQYGYSARSLMAIHKLY